jgi:hypothetical protein
MVIEKTDFMRTDGDGVKSSGFYSNVKMIIVDSDHDDDDDELLEKGEPLTALQLAGPNRVWAGLSKQMVREAKRRRTVPDETILYQNSAMLSTLDNGMDEVERGKALVRKFRENLMRLDNGQLRPRSPAQAEVHEELIPCMAKIFFGTKCFARNKKRIMREMNWSLHDLIQAFELLAARRWGKTEASAMYIAACIATIPNMSVLIYATARKQTEEVITKTISYLNLSFPELKIRHSKSAIRISYGPEDIRTVVGLSASPTIRCPSLFLSLTQPTKSLTRQT